ncbi:DUF5060 domain-containing protein [Aquirufa aurantiipilula]|uniref:DUF5060 domain-containing protein n=1 Tax=Aquirufa aurantiipilula TaxID=2696561 RepID=UPI001CAA5589|nr:DUF5060 domain-containing protein [Aquirufa aurantiipilula]MBZ1327488.1 DUF5605 domain-containing protein [Aquirufa aurantiipilula]
MKKSFLLGISFLLFLSFGLMAQESVERWNRVELSYQSAFNGNGYQDVEFKAIFVHADTTITISGFYDGNQTFKLRFMPTRLGIWKYTTQSNIAGLAKKTGTVECIAPSSENHGMVRTNGSVHFTYADGKTYYPFGTTAYAWNHMGAELQQLTLNSLKKSGFNKIRMCVFPKNYDLVKEEPRLYPFVLKESKINAQGNEVKIWDYNQFNPAFFQQLEKQIDALQSLGIEADLILFHPYDKGRWGFDAMPREVNIRYIQYLLARISSFRNVWWSMANEWDYVKSKTIADWDELTKTVVKSDPYRHLCSIHGATATYYEYWKPEFTHISVQDESPVQSPNSAAMLRNVYHKPVVLDEVGYEGNLKSRWGRYSSETMTHLIWNGVMGGTYVTHGESFMFKDHRDTIFWAKGGIFRGESWKRVRFLRQILEEGPGPLSLSDVSRDNQTSSGGKGNYLIYFGKQIQEYWMFNLPINNGVFGKLTAGTRFRVDIIDTYGMTIQTLPEIFETGKESDYRFFDKDHQKIRLPEKPYLALRIREIR